MGYSGDCRGGLLDVLLPQRTEHDAYRVSEPLPHQPGQAVVGPLQPDLSARSRHVPDAYSPTLTATTTSKTARSVRTGRFVTCLA